MKSNILWNKYTESIQPILAPKWQSRNTNTVRDVISQTHKLDNNSFDW